MNLYESHLFMPVILSKFQEINILLIILDLSMSYLVLEKFKCKEDRSGTCN